MRVFLRHGDLAVPKQLLDGIEVQACLHKLRGEVVPAVVQAKVRQCRSFHERPPRCVDALHVLAIRSREYEGLCWGPPLLLAPRLEDFERLAIERNPTCMTRLRRRGGDCQQLRRELDGVPRTSE